MKKIWELVMSLFKRKPKPPALKVGKTLAGYGRVNRWCNGGKDIKASIKILERDIKECAKRGVKIYCIEFMSWGRYSLDTPAHKASIEACYETLVKLVRDNGMWLLLKFLNSNTGSGKYGDPKVPISAQMPLVEWGIALVKKHGKSNILFNPMGETSGSFNTRLEARLAQEFGSLGFTLVNNHGSRPTSKPGWATWNSWHPFKVTDRTPADQIIVSDTGMIIMQLCEGLEGKGKPAMAKSWAASIKATGAPAVVFYHFKYPGHDSATIKAMGDGVK